MFHLEWLLNIRHLLSIFAAPLAGWWLMEEKEWKEQEEVKRIKIIKDIYIYLIFIHCLKGSVPCYKSKKHKEHLLIIKRNKNIRRTSRIASFFYHCENLWEQPESCKNLNKFYDFWTAVTFLAIPALLVCIYMYVCIYVYKYICNIRIHIIKNCVS